MKSVHNGWEREGITIVNITNSELKSVHNIVDVVVRFKINITNSELKSVHNLGQGQDYVYKYNKLRIEISSQLLQGFW